MRLWTVSKGSGSESPRARGILVHLGIYAALWLLLTRGDAASWVVGFPVILLALWARTALLPGPLLRVHPPALLLFIPEFLMLSLKGGIDVAQRAFSRSVRLAPDLLEYPVRLPPGAARVFFMNLISLLPGTLSADIQGDVLSVHVLDREQDTRADLARLEKRVARIFSVPLAREGERP